ncbi:MAG: phosphodiester glycosidase family protein [Sphaerochaetaceae bacterium]|nr:phosphodiester glycosidase family protein [Sphaerochaetaceae bacterium]
MRNTIITETHQNKEIQRFQVVEAFAWKNLQFASPGFDAGSIREIARLYRLNIVEKDPSAYGRLVFFHVPENIDLPFSPHSEDTWFFSRNITAKVQLQKLADEGSLYRDGAWISKDTSARLFLNQLETEHHLEMVSGKKDEITFIPIDGKVGFPSSLDSPLVVNSHFFLMDPTDLDSPFCELGTPHGLALKDGVVLNPPLNHRPCLLVDTQGTCHTTQVELTDLVIEIDTVQYRHERNAIFYFRPETCITPSSGGTDIVITGNKVVAVKQGGNTRVPMAGFVLSLRGNIAIHEPSVRYLGLEAYQFGIQVGPPMMRGSSMVDSLCCPFYNPLVAETSFPPTVYPLPFSSARAARIALGTNREGKPVLVWAEGASKRNYQRGKESSGASLLELAQFCDRQHYQEIINLDGGGSSQIIYEGKRYLKIADRYEDNSEAERPVPLVLVFSAFCSQ